MANALQSFEQLVANLGKPERRTLDGRAYLVSPITILPPGGGVMNGSKGPLFYSDPVCKAQPGAWNDIPITGRHPVAANGKHISANDPAVANQKIGFLANDHVKDGRRRVYGWLDVENAREYDRREGTSILADWESGRLQEVSTGLITQDSPAQNGASHNGRTYAWTVTGWTPDHLAVLPDQVGACSIADGCGVNNSEQAEAAKRTIWQKLGEFLGVTSNEATLPHLQTDDECDCGGTCDECKVRAENAESLNDKQNEIQRLLTERFGKEAASPSAVSSSGVYVADLYDNEVVYQLNGVMYRLPYSGGDGKWTLGGGQPEKVDRKTEYVPANNVRSLNTGKFKRRNAGYGKGEPHERAQAGAMMLSDRDRELGADAARQLAETGHNPASWVADEALWDRAKEAAAKTYAEGDAAYWPAVAHIYKRMGGEVKDATDNADDAFAAILNDIDAEDVINVFCATGEGGGVDPSCGGGKQEGEGDTGRTDRGGKVFLEVATERLKEQVADHVSSGEVDDAIESVKSGDEGPLAAAQRLVRDTGLTNVHLNKIARHLERFKPKRTNNESGSFLDEVINEGDTPMKPEHRATIVKELAANCGCWKGEEKTLNEMSDEQLVKHAKAYQRAQTDAITANAVRDVLKPPDDLAANDVPAFIKSKMKVKHVEADDDGDDVEECKEDCEATENRESARRIAANTARPRKSQTAEQWLTDPSVPEEIRHAARFAMNAERSQKEQIVQQLVANASNAEDLTEQERTELATDYMSMPLGKLQLRLKAHGRVQNTRHEPIGFYFGGGAGQPFVTDNAESDPETDSEIGMMDSPTVNFERRVEERQTA